MSWEVGKLGRLCGNCAGAVHVQERFPPPWRVHRRHLYADGKVLSLCGLVALPRGVDRETLTKVRIGFEVVE